MKTLFPIITLAAIAALFSGLRVEPAVTAVFTAGLLAIVALDYGPRRPVPVPPRRARRKLFRGALPRVLRTESRRLAA
jgi:hypothetical protein